MPASPKKKPGCLSILLPFRNPGREKPLEEEDWEELPYRVRDDFLSSAEFSFYKVLTTLAGERLVVLAKVRLADIFFVNRPNENYSYFNRIAQRHLDFLVCEPVRMRPLFGIELDDASHARPARMERDEFVEQVFEDAGLPLLRFPARREYATREIAERIAPFIQVTVPAQPASPAAVPVAPNANPFCPKCGLPMVLRSVSKGAHQGKQFFGCPNYPRCRQMMLLPEVG